MSSRRRRVCWHRNSLVPDCVCTRGAQHRRVVSSASRVCNVGTAPSWEAEGTNAVLLKHRAGGDVAQHIELAFPREERWSEPRGGAGLGGLRLNK